MERIYEELDEVKAENEKLKADCKSKSELCGNLRKAHNEQLLKIQETNLKVEKQAQELNDRAEEMSEVKQLLEDLKRSLTEKESFIKRASTANDKLRFDFDEKCQALEEQNRELLLALNEANQKNIDKEQKVNVFKAEIEGLKRSLSATQKKCVEAEREAKALKNLRERDEILLKLEDENRIFEDQLKWKNEQFKHLEEAHGNLKEQLRTSKKEWEHERFMLLDEISSLQTNLDSQKRISGDLQNQLQLCNQALAHEESRRKYLEVQVSELRTRYENTFAEYQDVKSQLECLTNQRDKEIAALRHSLCTKETFYKEMGYQTAKLERENQELLMSLKELREVQIHNGGSTSLTKMRNKLKSLEQIHKDCSANLRDKEAEWSSQLEKMDRELKDYRHELQRKDASLKELKMELESYYSLSLQLKMQNEEISVILLVLKAGLSEAQVKPAQLEGERDIDSDESKDHVTSLMKQLEMETDALARAQRAIEEEREKTASLLGRIETLEHLDVRSVLMQKEIDRYKDVLEESSKCNLGLKEKILLLESDYRKKLGEVCDALDAANLDLAEERKKTSSLSAAVESLHHIEAQRMLMQKELETYKEMLEESSRCQHHLEEQAKQREGESERKATEVCDALDMANLELAKEREKAASLTMVVESLDNHIEEQRVLMGKELDKYKEMLEEASRCQHHVEEQAKQMEKGSKRKLQEITDALDLANSELAEKTSEGHQVEFELWIWKSITERLKFELEENQELRKELEASLIAQVEVGEIIKQENRGLIHTLEARDSRISNFQQQILSLDQELKMSFETEKQRFLQITIEKEEILEDLQRQNRWLEQESLRRELESALLTQMCAEQSFEHEMENLIKLVEEKTQKIDDILQLVRSLEEGFNSSLNSLTTQLAEKHAEISLVIEAREKISAAETLTLLEIKEKKLMIVELEDEISNLQLKLDLQEKTLSVSKHQAQQIEAELECKQIEMKNLTNQLEEKLSSSDALVNELRSENRMLLEDALKSASERETLVGYLGGLSKFCDEDVQLTEMLGRILQSVDNKSGSLLKDNDQFESLKENMTAHPSPSTMKKFDAISDERSPFKQIN